MVTTAIAIWRKEILNPKVEVNGKVKEDVANEFKVN